MKKVIMMFLLLMAAGMQSLAQGIPAFASDTNNKVNIVFWHAPFDSWYNVFQGIYYKSDFPTMPSQGYITDFFIKIAYTTPAGSTLPGLTIKLGITSMNDYPAIITTQQFLSIDSTLTTVFYDSMFVLPAAISANGWLKLSLPQPFQYSMLPLPGDVPQNLMIHMSKSVYTPPPESYKFCTFGINYNGNRRRGVTAVKNNPPGSFSANPPSGNTGFLIGFNGYALSVDDPNKKVPFSVFPNPAKDKLYVRKEASGEYEVYNLSGIKVLEGKVKEGEEVNVQNLSPGMYLLRMGERITRFVKE